MTRTTAIGLLALSLFAPSFFVQSLDGARAARPSAATAALENGTLSLRFPEPGSAVLTNKLTGRTYALSAEPFVLEFESAGNRFRAAAGDSLLAATENISPTLLRLRYEAVGGKKGLAVLVDYELGEQAWYVRKRVTVVNGLGEVVVVHDATVDDVGFPPGALPAKAGNPVSIDGQVFWGMEWPIADAAIQDGRFRLTHFPAAAVAPGESWTSKTTGFGVSASDRIDEAFGRYIQVIRANRIDFVTFYFDWLCHDNSGPLESEILANFAALKRLRELYGLQFDIYNPDAGLVESQGTYFPQFKARFDQRYPNGLRTIADASSRLGMKLGLWIGPDGFGETPVSMAARRNQLLAWVKDSNVGLFKLDTVVSAIAHEDKYILEKKYQSLADTLAEARRIDPSFIAINHRVNNSPYMLTITDCLLWKGEETYVDVHIANTTAALYNRSASIGRELTSEFFKTPFRQFEDSGICFNSSVEKWADDLVAQAFGRASVLSPELYGMRRQVITAEGSVRNAFDGDPATRWSDGYARRSEFTGSPAPYRSDASVWRIDFGELTDVRTLALHIVRRTEEGFLDAVETSADLKTWARADGLSLEKAQGIPLFTELRQRGRRIKMFDVQVGDNTPVQIDVPLPPGRSRYVRLRGRNFSVSEIVGYDAQGRRVDRTRWHATNLFGETPRPGRILRTEHALAPGDFRPGQEFAVALHSGPAKFDPVDGAYVVAVVDGHVVVPRHRAPAYPYHNYEWNSSWLKAQKLDGMTFRLPIREEWTGKTVEFYVILFGEGVDAARAELHLATPREHAVERRLQVRSAPASRTATPMR